MTWTLAPCLVTLQAEVNAAHPDRPRGADGTIGDARHQAEISDHNPNSAGVVTAWDITTDDAFTDDLSEHLRLMGRDGDGRVKYVIFKGRIASARDAWKWRPYQGYSQHFDHIHLSVSSDPAQYDRIDPWHEEDDDMALSDDDKRWIDNLIKSRLKEQYTLIHKGTGEPTHTSLTELRSLIQQAITAAGGSGPHVDADAVVDALAHRLGGTP